MARPRSANPTPTALRKRDERERRDAGLKVFRIPVDIELARARFPDATDDADLARWLEELMADSLSQEFVAP